MLLGFSAAGAGFLFLVQVADGFGFQFGHAHRFLVIFLRNLVPFHQIVDLPGTGVVNGHHGGIAAVGTDKAAARPAPQGIDNAGDDHLVDSLPDSRTLLARLRRPNNSLRSSNHRRVGMRASNQKLLETEVMD